ncbi:hypothetical protein Tco_0926604 [Tanacetum coccineum]|uniref:Uncharacterized protein n=1 Tax=Tanacetum coccineum TaxID=301880 RepID=A0ABQ5DAA0_9ASTR
MPVGITVTCCPPRYAEEMLRLKDLGPNTPSGVPYTKDEIMAMVRRGKQRGYIPEALELKGDDGGACKLLGRLLGDVIEVLEVLAASLSNLHYSFSAFHGLFWSLLPDLDGSIIVNNKIRPFLLVMLRRELHKSSVLVIVKPTLDFSQIYFWFFWVNSVNDLQSLKNLYAISSSNLSARATGVVLEIKIDLNLLDERGRKARVDDLFVTDDSACYLGQDFNPGISLEERDMDTKLLSALESNNTLARDVGLKEHTCDYVRGNGKYTVTSCCLLPVAGPLFSPIHGQMVHTCFANITLNSARSSVVGVGVMVVVVIIVAVVVVFESSSVGQNFRFLRFIRGVVILVTSLNTWRVIPDETLHHFLRLWHHSGTLRLPILESSTMSGDHSFQSDGKIRLPSSGLQFEDSTSLSKVS